MNSFILPEVRVATKILSETKFKENLEVPPQEKKMFEEFQMNPRL